MSTLRRTISTPAGKRRYVRQLFATIADRYDVITRLLSCGQDQRWKRRLIAAARLAPGDRLLDLACGTGDLVIEAAPRVRQAVGLDVTERMLRLAYRRHQAAHQPGGMSRQRPEGRIGLPPRVAFVGGDMLALPFTADRFDVVTVGYGLRNVSDLPEALREIHRVLVPGGRLLSLDFNRPANPVVRTAYLAYLTVVGSTLGWVLHGDPDTYRYIPESIRHYPGAAGVSHLMGEAGFREVRHVPLLGGLMSLHLARRLP